MGFQKILCPVDFSDTSRQALSRAVELARSSGATITLMHVVPALVASPMSLTTASGLRGANLAAGGAMTDQPLEDWRHQLEAQDIRCEQARVVQGDPAAEILNAVREGGFDLVVLGTHGKTGVLGALLGSVTYKVVRTAGCSVLTVRSEGEG